jgi:hypothetical protein
MRKLQINTFQDEINAEMIKLIIQNGEAFNAFWNQVSHSKSVLSLLPSQVESKKSSENSTSVINARQNELLPSSINRASEFYNI